MRIFFSKALMLIAFLACFILTANAQSASITLLVTTTDGQEHAYQLTEESQLYFENGDRIVINDGTSNIETFQLADIRKMVCAETTGASENAVSTIQLIPNPSHDSFIIRNLQNNAQARIYTLHGQMVKSFEASEGSRIDISELAPGMYLLHIDGQTLKMMKL